jgi:hypothetical protein
MRHILPLPRPAPAMRLDLAETRRKSVLLLARQRLAAKDKELVIEKRVADVISRGRGQRSG